MNSNFKNHYDILFLIMGNGLSRVLMILLTMGMLKILGDLLYGKYIVFYSSILTMQIFLTLGLNPILIRKVASGSSPLLEYSKCIRIVFLNSLICFLIFYLIVESEIIESLSICSEINPISFLYATISMVVLSLCNSILYGLEKKNQLAVYSIINTVLVLIFVMASSVTKNLNIVFISLGIANTVSVAIFFIFYCRKIKFSKSIENYKKTIQNIFSFKWLELREYIKLGIPIFLSNLLVTPILTVIYIIMNKYELGKDIAVFSVAMQWYNIILFIPGILANLLLVEFSKNINAPSLIFYIKKVLLNFLITLFISLLVYVLLLILLPIYGTYYVEKAHVFWIFIFVALINSLNTVAGQFFIAVNKQIFGFYFNFVWAAFVILFTYFSVSKGYGILGVSVGFLISYLLHALNQNLFICYFLTHRS